MKKYVWLATLAFTILISGCGQKQNTKSSNSDATQVVHATTSNKSTQNNHSASLNKTYIMSSRNSYANIYNQIHAALPGVNIPVVNPFGEDQTVKVRAQGDVANYTLFFSNKTAAQAGEAPLQLQKITPESKVAADAAFGKINYHQLNAKLSRLALTSSVDGTVQYGDAATTIVWHIGRYSVTINSNGASAQETEQYAKKVANILANNQLPRTQSLGAINLSVGSNAGTMNSISWRETSAYFTVKGTSGLQVLRLCLILDN